MATRYTTNPAHPILWFLVGTIAIAELGMTAYRVHKHNEEEPPYWSSEYKHRLRFLLFASVWTTFLALLHWVFNMLVGSLLTFITWIFWLVGSILYHYVNNIDNLDCDNTRFDSPCRLRVAIEAVAWTLFGLTAFLFLATLFTVHRYRTHTGGYNNGFRRGYYDTY